MWYDQSWYPISDIRSSQVDMNLINNSWRWMLSWSWRHQMFSTFSFFGAGLMERTRQAQCNKKLLIEGRVKENHAIIETYPSSHNHGSGKWVPPILVSFHLGWFLLPWLWEKRIGTDLLKTNILDQSDPFFVSMQCFRSVVQVAKASGELSDVSDFFYDSAMVTNLWLQKWYPNF